MLQAPTNDRKTKAEASSKTAEHLPEQEQPTYLPGWIGSRQTQSFQQHKNLKALQKAYGNQAMLRMMDKSPAQTPVTAASPLSRGGILQRKCACGNTAGSSGSCAECQEDGEMALPGNIQTKLTINQPGDRYEQEADRVADQVMTASAHPAVSDAPPRIQRFTGQATGQADMAAPASVDRVLSSPGRPLEPSLQQDMGQRFGHDFSQVRVHTDAAAERSAQDVNANAYTVGENIVFGIGQYSPETHEGRSLIAHELTHVLQQSQGSSIATIFLQRDPNDNQLTPKDRQLACVVRRGGCSSGTYSRDGGTADEDIPKYNKICRDEEKTNYDGSDMKPTPDECNNPPKEPLPAGAKILLGAFLVVGSGLAIAAVAVAAEAIIPIVIASIVETGTTGYNFYLANAFAVNEIGLFTAGLLISCEGNVFGLLHAITTDPEQAIKILAEVYILHTIISVNNGSPRSATVPAKLLPPSEQQANSEKIRFKTVGPPHFEDTKPPEPIPSLPAPKTTASKADPAPAPTPVLISPKPEKQVQKPATLLAPGLSTGEADEAAALKPARSSATLLGEKAGGYDATQGGKKIINSEEFKKDKQGNPIIVRDITIREPDDAIQIKTITQIDKYGRPSLKPLPQLVADNVSAALKKAYNQPMTRARARTPLPGTNIYERTNVEAPKKITIIVQVPGEVTKEMQEAAAKILATDTRVAELPPIDMIIQTRQVETK